MPSDWLDEPLDALVEDIGREEQRVERRGEDLEAAIIVVRLSSAGRRLMRIAARAIASATASVNICAASERGRGC